VVAYGEGVIDADDPQLDLTSNSTLDPLCGLPGYADRVRPSPCCSGDSTVPSSDNQSASRKAIRLLGGLVSPRLDGGWLGSGDRALFESDRILCQRPTHPGLPTPTRHHARPAPFSIDTRKETTTQLRRPGLSRLERHQTAPCTAPRPPDPHNPVVQIMGLTSNSTLYPVPNGLLIELQDRGDLGDSEKLVVDIGRAALRAHAASVVWRRVAGAGARRRRAAARLPPTPPPGARVLGGSALVALDVDVDLQRRPRAARHDPRLQDPLDQGDRAGARRRGAARARGRPPVRGPHAARLRGGRGHPPRGRCSDELRRGDTPHRPAASPTSQLP